MTPYIAEFVGTMILILLGDGVVANVNLNKSGMKGAGAVQITLAWGLAVLVPAFIFGAASGASFNPALTIALAADGSFAWSMVPGYIVAQLAGAFCGACLVYLLFKDQFDATEDAATKRGVFCTAPAVRNIPRNILSEAVGTLYSYLPSRVWHRFRIWRTAPENFSYSPLRICRYVSGRSDRICNQSGKRSGSSSCTCSASDSGKRFL